MQMSLQQVQNTKIKFCYENYRTYTHANVYFTPDIKIFAPQFKLYSQYALVTSTVPENTTQSMLEPV